MNRRQLTFAPTGPGTDPAAFAGRRVAGLAIAALIAGASLLVAAPVHAEATATVKVKTQRMSDANLGSQQAGWYNPGDHVTLVCSKRGQAVKGFFSFNIANGGWDNLWYKTSDGNFVADVDIETGTLNDVADGCGNGGGPAPAPVAAAGRATGQTTNVNAATVGQCTDGAMQKWFQASGSYPVLRGNAKDWPGSAQASGWTVVNDAQPRSLVVFQPGVQGASGNGHVAWVNSTSQRPDGLYLNITEMNNSQHGGVGAWWTRDVKDVPGMSYILLP